MTLLRRAFLPSTADLLAFEAAARHQSVSRAAEELHLTQSAVSRQIRQLENQIGTALFHRVRQRVVLTDAGRVYAADLQGVLQQLSAITQKTMAFSSADGLLNLAVLPTLGTRWLIPRLPRFMAAPLTCTSTASTPHKPWPAWCCCSKARAPPNGPNGLNKQARPPRWPCEARNTSTSP